MRPSSLFLTTVIVVAAAAYGQQTAPDSKSLSSSAPAVIGDAQHASVDFYRARGVTACPLSMDVRMSSPAVVWKAKGAQPPVASPGQHKLPESPLQRIDVNLRNTGSRDIVSFDAHVQGIAPVVRFVPVDQFVLSRDHSTPAPVPFHSDQRMSAGAELSLLWTLANATGVEWVQLDRIIYADGFTWQRQEGDACKVRPDPIMPVN